MTIQDIKVPPLGESISEAVIARWTKSIGDQVEADELLAELETDKVTLEVNASATGILTEIICQEGETVTVGQVMGKLTEHAVGSMKEDQAESAVSVATPGQDSPTTPAQISKQPSDAMSEYESPAVRRLLAETQADPSKVSATGRGGRLTKEDVLTHLARPVIPSPVSVSKEPVADAATDSRVKRVKMTRLRQRIAERLKESQNTAAILTTFNEVDMSAIIALRQEYREAFEKKHGIKLGFMSFFVKATLRALQEIPAVNAEILGDEIIYKNYYDIGVAVSAPQGLVVPVVREVDRLSFADLEKSIDALGRRARDGKLTTADMAGGTFTISNGGIFGSLMSTPILNPPQTGILGMHKIQERPIALNGAVVIRPMMYIALSYDHRLIDGREAVTFLVRIKEGIESPERLLLDI